MRLHPNAKRTPKARGLLVERVKRKGWPPAWAHTGPLRTQLGGGRIAAAAKTFRRAARIDPEDPVARAYLGEAEITLAAGTVQATGRALGADTRFESHRVVAQATLDAIAKLVQGDPDFSLGELEETELGSRRVLLICINQTTGRHETNLIGSCEVGYDPTRAVIYAVLDAVNRLLGSLQPREPVEYEIGPAPTE